MTSQENSQCNGYLLFLGTKFTVLHFKPVEQSGVGSMCAHVTTMLFASADTTC